jgi:hypothetical protein
MALYDMIALTITKHKISMAHTYNNIKKKSVNTGLKGYIPETYNIEHRKGTKIVPIDKPVFKPKNIAVIDVETNYDDKAVSIGIVIGDSSTYKVINAKYYVIYPNANIWGMYNDKLFMHHKYATQKATMEDAVQDIIKFLSKYSVENIFAYNANFDYRHVPGLSQYHWYDIMKIAAYKQYNPHLSSRLEYCSTGRLKSKFGVQDMMIMLTASRNYEETHNALYDALDELTLMKLIGLPISKYDIAKIN